MSACTIIEDKAVIDTTDLCDTICTIDILLLLSTEDDILISLENENLISLENG